MRCTKCNTKYRRVPLVGTCTKRVGPNKVCGNELTLTVHEKSVKKYLEIVIELARRYDLPEYTRQRIELTRKFMEDAFAPEATVSTRLVDFA